MKFIIRGILITCLVLLVQIELVDLLHVQSKQLAMFGNLPHRALGGLFWAHQLQPQREDYVYDYLIEFIAADKSERLLEGQTRPVVPMYIAKMAAQYPRSPDIQKLRFVIMAEHLSGNSKFNYPKKD